jgi:hypothetical protein
MVGEVVCKLLHVISTIDEGAGQFGSIELSTDYLMQPAPILKRSPGVAFLDLRGVTPFPEWSG